MAFMKKNEDMIKSWDCMLMFSLSSHLLSENTKICNWAFYFRGVSDLVSDIRKGQ
jgi:hypothetical protein